MALIPKFHVVASERVVYSGATIKMGQIVALNTSGQVVLQGAKSAGDMRDIPYGVAGDTKSTTASAMPGIVSGWQNRASDYFDETKASSRMTVYHSGGEFATDQFHTNVASATVGQLLYAKDGQLDTYDQDGHQAQGTTWGAVAQLTQAAAYYPSGVPGVDVTGDQKLTGDNTNTYIEFKLLI